MARVYIFGNGGHARVIASLLETDPTFVVPEATKVPGEISETAYFDRLPAGDVYIGIGDNTVRAALFNRLEEIGRSPAICVAPNAFVARDAHLDPGTQICAGAVIGSRAQIGRNVIVNTLSSIDHDCVVGDHTQITVGVGFGGGVKVGGHCFFGLKSAVVPNVLIGDHTKIRAGSLILKDVPSRVLIGGNPAAIIRVLE